MEYITSEFELERGIGHDSRLMWNFLHQSLSELAHNPIDEYPSSHLQGLYSASLNPSTEVGMHSQTECLQTGWMPT